MMIHPKQIKPTNPLGMNRQSKQAQGLTFWFPGLKMGAEKAYDYSDNHYDCVISGATWKASPLHYGALDFGGGATSDKAQSIAAANIMPNVSDQPFTMSAWVYLRSIVDNNNYAIIEVQGGTASRHKNPVLGASQVSGNYYIWTDGVDFADQINGYVPSLNQWHLITYTRDASRNWKYYLDGIYQIGGTHGGSVTWDTMLTVTLGRRTADATGTMDGMVVDARIYSRCLTASEVMELYDPATRFDLYQPERVIVPANSSFSSGSIRYGDFFNSQFGF